MTVIAVYALALASAACLAFSLITIWRIVHRGTRHQPMNPGDEQ
jgi:hypothetical protein